jgi:hypothetical protein
MHKMRISLALIVFTLIAFQIRPVWGADSDQKLLLKKSFPTESRDRLKVNGYAGNVKIYYWNKNEVEVKIYGSSEAVEYFDFDVNSDELGIKINASKKDEIEKVKNFSLQYEISVPRNYNVKVSTGGNSTIQDGNGPVEISTLDGKIKAVK